MLIVRSAHEELRRWLTEVSCLLLFEQIKLTMPRSGTSQKGMAEETMPSASTDVAAVRLVSRSRNTMLVRNSTLPIILWFCTLSVWKTQSR